TRLGTECREKMQGSFDFADTRPLRNTRKERATPGFEVSTRLRGIGPRRNSAAALWAGESVGAEGRERCDGAHVPSPCDKAARSGPATPGFEVSTRLRAIGPLLA